MEKEAVVNRGELETIKRLEAKNIELDGKLFSIFGGGKRKTLIFPTPIIISGAKKYGAVTLDGNKLIHVGNDPEGESSDIVSYLINEKLGVKPSLMTSIDDRLSSIGYANGELILSGNPPFIIDVYKARQRKMLEINFFDVRNEWKEFSDLRLTAAPDEIFRKIFAANMERAIKQDKRRTA